jgi:predicted anti-sigma-YlaC factor YlaD
MKCKDAYRRICEDVGLNLNSPKCRAIKKHLESCPDCSAYYDSVRKTVFLYQEYPNPRMPGSSRKKLHSILRTL